MANPSVQSAGTGDIHISLLTGEAARAWIAGRANWTAWNDLYVGCPWATTFQTAEFFCVWNRHYGALWQPVLVTGFCARERLAALMPLAVADGVVTGAGAHQAEYHGWLSNDDCPANFFKDAVDALLTEFPGHALRLRYLPSGTPEAAVSALIDGDRRAIARPEDRPLLALGEAAINETLKKKGTRSKINRLKRLGAYSVRRMGVDEFERRFDEIAAMCDFRQGAVNDSCPFLDDAQKRPFHLDWVRSMPREVHVSGMFVDEELISVLIFALSKREAHIAITAHSPAHAEHSPGKIHIYEAALALARDGYAVVDVTPGGDEWKSRFATKTDKVVDLTVFASARKAAIVRFRRSLGATLRPAVERGRAVVAAMTRARGADANPASATGDELLWYLMATTGAAAKQTDVRVGALADLMRYGPGVTGQSRQTFLRRALARMEAGERCYSLHGPQGILGLGWKSRDKSGLRLCDFSAGAGADARQTYSAIVQRMIADGTGEAAALCISASNADLRAAVERLGFQRKPL